jgi:hypothetical protein
MSHTHFEQAQLTFFSGAPVLRTAGDELDAISMDAAYGMES